MFSHVSGHTFLANSISDQATILDVGANHGNFSTKMSRLHGGNYHLVEANPRLAKLLADAGRFSVSHCAVADKEGSLEFHIAECDEGSSLLTLPEHSEYHCVLRETVVVQAKTLKSLADELGLSRIDLLKMDIEGAEVGVLNAIEPELLERVGQLSVEFHGAPEFGFHIDRQVEAVIRRLEGLGFRFIDFSYPDRTDSLFLNQRYHPISPLNLRRIRVQAALRAGMYRAVRRLPSGVRDKLRRAVRGPAPQEVS